MFYRIAIVAIVFVILTTACAVRAENVIVIPGRPDVPVVINYHDARWAVVEGEHGLNRPGSVPVVIGGRFVGPVRGMPRRGSYYPMSGEKPAQGRVEREPTGPAPVAAEDYSRSWQAAPAPTATQNQPEGVPPADLPNGTPMGEGIYPPPVVVPVLPRRKH